MTASSGTVTQSPREAISKVSETSFKMIDEPSIHCFGESATSFSLDGSWEDSTASFEEDYLPTPQEFAGNGAAEVSDDEPRSPPSPPKAPVTIDRSPRLPSRRPPGRSVSGGGRRCPKRGLSASCSTLGFDITNLAAAEGQALSREQSKLDRLSRSSHSRRRAPPRSGSAGSRRAMKRDDLNGSMSQLQVGDMVLLANKELTTSSHLRRSMPKRSSAKHVEES